MLGKHLSIGPPVSRMRMTLWKGEYSRYLWPICRRTKTMRSERSSSGSTKCRARIAWPISMDLISHQTNYAHWSASGSRLSKPTSLSSLRTITSFVFSPSHLRRDDPTRSRKLRTLDRHKYVRYARRWSRLFNAKHPAAHCPSWQLSWSLRWLAVKSKKPRKAFIPYKMFVNPSAVEFLAILVLLSRYRFTFEKSNCWRRRSST